MSERDEINLYFDGVIDGTTRFAYWKDGVQYVGTCGKTLREALEEIRQERFSAYQALYV